MSADLNVESSPEVPGADAPVEALADATPDGAPAPDAAAEEAPAEGATTEEAPAEGATAEARRPPRAPPPRRLPPRAPTRPRPTGNRRPRRPRSPSRRLPSSDSAGEAAVDAPAGATVAPGTVIAALWLSEPSRERLRSALGCELTDDPNETDGSSIVAVSTRGPRARAIPLTRRLRAEHASPVAVVCHPGGDGIALELMRAGACTVVAEGNEAALQSLLGGSQAEDEPLLIAYEQQVGTQRAEETSSSNVDPVTDLPGASTFQTRLDEMVQSGTLGTVGFGEVVNFAEATSGLEQQAIDVLRRRLATLYRDLLERSGAELFAITPSRFAFIGKDLPADRAHELGIGLAQIARSFAPGGTVPMLFGVGHAGPEVASDVAMLRELAERALDAAAQEGPSVVNAEHLSNTLVSAAELDLALRMVTYLSDNDGYPGSHSSRVAELSTELGRQLGYEGHELIRIRVSALLHDVGKVGLPPEAVRDTPGLPEETLAIYRGHAMRGSRFVETTAGPLVAKAIRAHHERWDGSGFPDGLKGEDIPMASRIIAVADAFDALRTTPTDDGRPPTAAECMGRLRDQSDSAFDPMVVEAAEMTFPR